jgi:hypothetical protein
MITLTIHDETATGKILQKIILELKEELITVEELIKQRVLKEVEEYNKKKPEYFNGLVQPAEAEKHLNGYKLKKVKRVDGEKQCYVALEAFTKNGFFILVDDKQVESLQERLLLNENSKISFVKLTPLVGG